MSASKKSNSIVTLLLFGLAIGLLLFSTIGSTRAALNVQSEILKSDVGMLDIRVELDNADGAVSGSALLSGMIAPGERIKPGMVYDRPVSVTNSGKIDEYVRVVVYKYWQNKSGDKDVRFDPDLIELVLAGGWTKDTTAETLGEKAVYYYTGGPLTSGESVPLLETVTINDSVLRLATQINPEDPGGQPGVIQTVYEYDGATFCIEIEADGVQTHNAKDAILSAWGKSVTVTDGGPITGGIG